MKRSKRTLHIKHRLGLALLLATAFGLSFYLKGSSYLLPGPLSAQHPRGQILEGYVSHAEFQQECRHCHAPVHCIGDERCQKCHQDVAAQRAAGEGLHSRLPGVERCQTCHPEHGGAQVVITDFAFGNVDHEMLAGFSLVHHQEDYAGRPLNCESCHSQDRFSSKTLDCLSCHAEGDHDFLAEHMRAYGSDCVVCHDGRDRMANFEHAVYPLDGAHAGLACQNCHQDYNYSTGPLACHDCHADPPVHRGAFGLDCLRCHTTTAWAPAALTRHIFPIDHGEPGQEACETCHTNTYVDYTCYGCHDHLAEDMRLVHGAEGIEDYPNCAECHPTGAPEEARRAMQGALPPAEEGLDK